MKMTTSAVWLYDGVCVLCNRAVQFTLTHEKAATIQFVAIQSDEGRQLAARHGIDPDNPESFIFVDNGIAHLKFDGILALCKHLKAPANLIQLFRILPKFVLNWIYDRIAQNRYRWFGKRASCHIPDRADQHRFIL